MIKERPILFSGEMVRSLLDGRKSQTRRVIKKQPTNPHVTHDEGVWGDTNDPVTRYFGCPHGQSGDRLWVKETWQEIPDDGGTIVYRATDPDWETIEEEWTWRPSIFMRREYSRITLEIVSVRVERVQEISEGDAIAEGVQEMETEIGPFYSDYEIGGFSPCKQNPFQGMVSTARQSYETLWNSINGKKHPWSENPFVWVIEFRKL